VGGWPGGLAKREAGRVPRTKWIGTMWGVENPWARGALWGGVECRVEFVLVAGDTFEDGGVDRVLIQKLADIADRSPRPLKTRCQAIGQEGSVGGASKRDRTRICSP